MIKNLFKKINGNHLAIAAFIVYLILIIFSQKVLTGDEVFYYHQALELRHLKFVNFENTQPLLWPLSLALTFSKNVIVLRSLAALFMALSVLFLFNLTKNFFNQKVALLASFIFAFSKFTVQYAITIHTEALFIFLTLLSFIFFLKLQEKPILKNYLLFGFVMGLAIETKIIGLTLPFFFCLYSFFIIKKFF